MKEARGDAPGEIRGNKYYAGGVSTSLINIVSNYRHDYDMVKAVQRTMSLDYSLACQCARQLMQSPEILRLIALAQLKDVEPRMTNKRLFVETLRQLCTHFDPKIQVISLKLMFDYMKETGEIGPLPQKTIDIRAKLLEIEAEIAREEAE